ncbi:MAG: hypothetical protein AB7V43_11445 [Acidimicrobiia bacterium]
MSTQRARFAAARRAAYWLVLTTGVLFIGWVAWQAKTKSDAVADRREMYEAFPTYPGAVKASDDSYAIRDDNGGTGDVGVRVVWRLPDDAVAADVMAFYRSAVPPKWTAATDATCEALRGTVPEPVMTLPDGSPDTTVPATQQPSMLVGLNRELTVFTDQHPGHIEGFTISLRRQGDARLAIFDEPTLACGPAGSPPEPDPFTPETP